MEPANSSLPNPVQPVSDSNDPAAGLPPVAPVQDGATLPGIPADPAVNTDPIVQTGLPASGAPASDTADLQQDPATPGTPEPQQSADPQAVQPTGKFSQHAPDVAEDVDLIEKEWVSKAKAIIGSTQGNPNEQSKEMSRFKADYLKTRYSKDIKVSDQ